MGLRLRVTPGAALFVAALAAFRAVKALTSRRALVVLVVALALARGQPWLVDAGEAVVHAPPAEVWRELAAPEAWVAYSDVFHVSRAPQPPAPLGVGAVLWFRCAFRWPAARLPAAVAAAAPDGLALPPAFAREVVTAVEEGERLCWSLSWVPSAVLRTERCFELAPSSRRGLAGVALGAVGVRDSTTVRSWVRYEGILSQVVGFLTDAFVRDGFQRHAADLARHLERRGGK